MATVVHDPSTDLVRQLQVFPKSYHRTQHTMAFHACVSNNYLYDSCARYTHVCLPTVLMHPRVSRVRGCATVNYPKTIRDRRRLWANYVDRNTLIQLRRRSVDWGGKRYPLQYPSGDIKLRASKPAPKYASKSVPKPFRYVLSESCSPNAVPNKSVRHVLPGTCPLGIRKCRPC